MTCCVSSPALDVIAVGCADGKIHVHNIRYDEEVITFSHSMRGAVSALSFSTGDVRGHFSCSDFYTVFHSEAVFVSLFKKIEINNLHFFISRN